MKENNGEFQNEVKFYHPEIDTSDLDYLIRYINIRSKFKEVIQINLDNCTIQRMEKLTESSTIDDLHKVGLYPLYRILNECPNVALSSIGTIEMPGSKTSTANEHYKLFCRKFWKNHVDDPNATFHKFNNSEVRINFHEFSDDKKQTIGIFYIPFLLIQKILIELKDKPGLLKLQYYIYGIIHYLDMISAFELEIAKYAFWNLEEKQIMALPDKIRERRKFIRKNFVKEQTSFSKCKQFCLNAAMDSFWLRAIILGMNEPEDIGNGFYITEYLLATNDDKLYFLAKDITPKRIENSFGYQFEVSREKELYDFPYWKEVDGLSEEILLYRKRNPNFSKYEEKSKLVSTYVKEIENDLEKILIL